MKYGIIAFVLTLFMGADVAARVAENGERLPAFPGAEGFGMYVTGGRGGEVYHVTRLDDDTLPGSFRHACMQQGPRTIVFDVSGTIFLKSQLRLKNPDVTIAGQTAPGDGVCIADYPFLIQADNTIVRFMRFRLGDRQMAHHEGDGLGGSKQTGIMVDHCSVSWSIDECISVYGMRDCTVQWCIGSHSLNSSGHHKGQHGYGGNWGGSGASYHHNLLSCHRSRTPRLGPSPFTQTDERMDLRCNVIYNHGSGGCYGGEGMTVNIVNNYFRPSAQENTMPDKIANPGIRTLRYCLNTRRLARDWNALTGDSIRPDDITATREGTPADGRNLAVIAGRRHVIDMSDSTITVGDTKIKVGWNVWVPMLHKWGQFFVSGNVNHSYPAVNEDNWNTGVVRHITPGEFDNYWDDGIASRIKLESPMPFAPVTTHSAAKAYELVLNLAGASLHRDEYDRTVTDDVRHGTVSYTPDGIIDSQQQVVYADGSRGWPQLRQATPPADTDGDGIPDAWETRHGLDPNNPSDRNLTAPSGYTWLEEYMNSLVSHIMQPGMTEE